MNLTTEQLEQLETMAGLFFKIPEILVSIGIPVHLEDEFSNIVKFDNEHPAFIAYQRGRLTAEIEIRQSIKQAALNGSNPAQNTMIDYFKGSKI